MRKNIIGLLVVCLLFGAILFSYGYFTVPQIWNKVLVSGGSAISTYYTEQEALNLVYDATNTAIRVYQSFDSTFADTGVFAATKTADTTLIAGVAAGDPVVVSWRDASGAITAPLACWCTAGTLFVRREEADTAAVSDYTYIRLPR